MMQSFVVPDGSILLDTSGKITPHMIPALKAWRVPSGHLAGQPAIGVIRYVSLYQVNQVTDIDPVEAALILDNFDCFGLVQHCLAAPHGQRGWTASPQLGALKGVVAKKHADLLAYPDDSMVAYDDEDVIGGDIAGEIDKWVDGLGGRPPLLYTGFSPGLTSHQLWELPTIHCYWGAPGPWDVDVCGVAMRQQYPSVTIGGMFFDVNVASADAKGRRVVFATAA